MVRITDQEHKAFTKLDAYKDITHVCSEIQKPLKETNKILNNLKRKELLLIKKNFFMEQYKARAARNLEIVETPSPAGGRFWLYWNCLLPYADIPTGMFKTLVHKIVQYFKNYPPVVSGRITVELDFMSRGSIENEKRTYVAAKNLPLRLATDGNAVIRALGLWEPEYRDEGGFSSNLWLPHKSSIKISLAPVFFSIEDYIKVVSLRHVVNKINQILNNIVDIRGNPLSDKFTFGYRCSVVAMSRSRRYGQLETSTSSYMDLPLSGAYAVMKERVERKFQLYGG